jgi:predicted kinase
MNQLVLIRGLPGSGKSTMARTLALVGYVHLEADQFFVDEDGDYDFRADELPAAHAWCLEAATLALSERRNVVVANTFTELWEMEPYRKAADIKGALFRVIEATGNYRSVHRIPPFTLSRMRARWQPLDMPDPGQDARFLPPRREVVRLRPVR